MSLHNSAEGDKKIISSTVRTFLSNQRTTLTKIKRNLCLWSEQVVNKQLKYFFFLSNR